jgi:hypothetical protein
VQTLDQIVRREINHLDIVGTIEDSVRHGLAHTDLRDLRDHVVEAFDMLDVERRVDVDARRQQLLDIEIALRMAAAGRVGVRQFIDQHERGSAREDRVEVHLLERTILVVDAAARQELEPFEQGARFLAAMGLDEAHHHVDAFAARGLGGAQHLERLTDAGRGAEEYLQAALALACRLAKERVGRRALIALRGLGVGHRLPSEAGASPRPC